MSQSIGLFSNYLLIFVTNNEEHRLENLEPEPGEPRLEILEAWAYFENHEPEPEPRA